MKLSLLTATMFLCTSGCGEVGKLMHHQHKTLHTSNETEKVLNLDSGIFDHKNYENALVRDILQLYQYSFANKITDKEKELISHILDNLKLDKIQRALAEDNNSIVFYENGEENYILYPNFDFGLDATNQPVWLSKIADSNRDEVVIALSLDKTKRANIDHCLYDWYIGSENYLTQLNKYTQQDIENLLSAFQGGRSVTYKQ